MSQHRYDAKDPKYEILYNHFNQPGHDRCLTMKVRIIEKIYHHANSPILSTPYRTDRELFWIKELGTAMTYGCNDNIKWVGNLASPGCSEINVMSLFNTITRTKCSHGHKRIQHPNVKKSSKPRTLQYTFNDLLSNIQKPHVIHHIRTILGILDLTKEASILFLLSTDCLVLYVTWRPFVFSNQFDLNLFMTTTENSSIFRLESMILTSATFLIEKRS